MANERSDHLNQREAATERARHILLSVLVGLYLLVATIVSFVILGLIMIFDGLSEHFGRMINIFGPLFVVLLWLPVATIWLFKRSANERD